MLGDKTSAALTVKGSANEGEGPMDKVKRLKEVIISEAIRNRDEARNLEARVRCMEDEFGSNKIKESSVEG
jgi:hypothetical protein